MTDPSDALLSRVAAIDGLRHHIRGVPQSDVPERVRYGITVMERILTQSPDYLVGPTVHPLITQSAGSIPLDTTITADLLPTPLGWVVPASPIIVPAAADIAGIAWFVDSGSRGVAVNVFRRLGGHLRATAYLQARFGATLEASLASVTDDDGDAEPGAISALVEAGARYLLALWLFMGQEIAVAAGQRASRAARKQGQRYDLPDQPVRVVELRRTRLDGYQPPEDEGHTEWHHRWLVRGHWRKQRVGVGRSEIRPTWIRPHIKGPDGLPVKAPDKLTFEVRR